MKQDLTTRLGVLEQAASIRPAGQRGLTDAETDVVLARIERQREQWRELRRRGGVPKADPEIAPQSELGRLNAEARRFPEHEVGPDGTRRVHLGRRRAILQGAHLVGREWVACQWLAQEFPGRQPGETGYARRLAQARSDAEYYLLHLTWPWADDDIVRVRDHERQMRVEHERAVAQDVEPEEDLPPEGGEHDDF